MTKARAQKVPAQEIHEIVAERMRRARERGEAAAKYGLTHIAARLAIRLEDLRAQQHLTLQELADRVGTSKAHVSRLLSGRYTGLTMNTLARLAAALDCDLEITLKPRAPRRELTDHLRDVRRKVAKAGLRRSVVREAVEAARKSRNR